MKITCTPLDDSERVRKGRESRGVEEVGKKHRGRSFAGENEGEQKKLHWQRIPEWVVAHS